MKRVISFLLVFVICITLNCFSCNANNSEINVSVNPLDMGILINGTFGSKYGNKKVILSISKKDSTFDNVSDESGFIGDIIYMDQIKTTENGDFSFDKFIPGESSGSFTIKVIESFEQNTLSYDIYIPSAADVNSFIDSINSDDLNSLKETLNNEVITPKVGVGMKLYSLLSDEQKINSCNMIIGMRSISAVSTLFDAYTRLNECCAATAILKSANAETLYKYINVDELNLDDAQKSAVYKVTKPDIYGNTSTMKKLSNMNKEEQLKVLSLIGGNDYNSSEDLFGKIDSAVIWYSINNVKLWTDVTDVLVSFSDILTTLDYDTYKSSKYKSEIDKALIDKNYGYTIKQLCDYINDAAKNGTKVNNNTSSGNTTHAGSGGGGGGSAGGSSFGIPASSVVIGPTNENIANITNKKPEFSDITGYEWARDDIMYLVDNNIVNGKTNTLFCPGDTVTREEFVKMIVLAFNLNDASNRIQFGDVNTNEWYYPYITKAISAGIIKGSEGNFGIGQPITRQDMAVMCARTLNIEEYNGILDFKDASDIADYAYNSITYLFDNKIISGYEDNTFKPYELCLRAQAAKVICRLMKLKR